ncbi:stage II sporulation protein M [Lysobacter enzymogenes]|uniref:Integral membrane protein n=1 Tax=Lysobacter enzymogenes TaxID=69 RepID=A0A0S2DNV9_LYSEN|nr:stage II sporulation protein M [Lysobacter enzymogenes]ALN60343.1 integral membrane protein [Lysobacter enzymogenes]QCW28295.1 stage II sporulation protein M [Lysobacter enzymogenes]QQQ01692.1 stage II sporulation protein M [Lysobacter enzymogenes]
MKQERFVERHQAEWREFELWLERRSDSARRARSTRREWSGIRDDEMPARHRRLCQQLALARRRGYSAVVTDRLQQLMQRGHSVLYRTKPAHPRRAVEFLLAGFPRLVRAEWRCMLAAALLFLVPLVSIFVAIQVKPDLASGLFPPQMLAQFEQMYDPASKRSLGRTNEDDLQMFAHYIGNNVGIGFQTFATGLVAGVGTVFVLIFNGIMIGGVAGHLQAVGHGDPFWRFVAGHSAPELTAIVIAGGAGLRMGLSLIAPGQRRRVDSLIHGGRRGAKICIGVFAMLVFAAFVEAFWSSIANMPASIKYAVGALLWALTALWLLRGGRNAAHQDDEDAA